jgi:hypothetical protein
MSQAVAVSDFYVAVSDFFVAYRIFPALELERSTAGASVFETTRLVVERQGIP